MRRRHFRFAVIAAVWTLAAGAVPVWASSFTADYTLTITNGTAIANPGAKPSDDATLGQVVQAGINQGIFPQVTASIAPAGSVQPTNVSTGPLTILSNSSGFDPNGLVDALNGDGSKLGLIFFNSGLAADGVLHFALDIDSAVSSTPPTLTSLTPGVQITADPVGQPSDGGNPPSNIPEPVSVLLWSAIAGVGTLRARSWRRQAASHT